MDMSRIYQMFTCGTDEKVGEPAPLSELVPPWAKDGPPALTETVTSTDMVSFPKPDDLDQNVYLGECVDPTMPEDTTSWYHVLRPVNQEGQ